MLEIERGLRGDIPPPGAMAVIAALQGYALEVYITEGRQADGTPILTRIHTFNPIEHGFEGEFKTRRVVLTSADVKSNPTALNHYNVLRTQEEANSWRIRLVDPVDHTGTLRLRVQTTRVPERLISDTNLTAADTLEWFFEGYQPFYNRVPVHQKTSVHVDGKAAVYGGFDAKADFSLTADEIKIRTSDIASAGTLHLRAAKGDVDADHAKIESRDATIAAAGSMALHATAVKAAGDVTLEAVIDTFLESLSHRVGDGDNYHDVKDATTVTTEGTLRVAAGRHNMHKGSETHSGRATILEAGGKVIDLPLALERQTYHTFKGGFSRDKYVHQTVSKHASAGVILSTAQDTQELYAPDLKALAVEIAGKNGVNSYAVHDTHESEYYCKKKRGGVFGGSKTTSSSSSSAYGKGAKLEATEHVKFRTIDGDVILTAIKVNAPHTVVEALKGGVKFRSATNTSASSTFTTGSNIAWQSYSSRAASDTTYTSSEFSGTVDVHAKEVVIEAVHAETMALIQRLNAHGADLRTNILHEVHTLEKKSGGGPTPALAAVVALAISIATQGIGSTWGAALAGEGGLGMVTAGAATTSATAAAAAGAGAVATTTAAAATTLTTAGAFVSGMTAGAFTSVCTQAGIALLNAEGDIGKAAKSLLTADAFKAVMTASVSAGITHGVADHYHMGLSGKMSLLGHGKAAALNAGAGLVGSVTIGGKSLSRSLEPAFVSAVVSAFTALGANKISDGYSGASDAVKLNYITHKISHALLGAAAGAALSKEDRAAGALAGATGAVVAEVVSEMIKSPQLTIAMDGPRLSEEEFKAQHQARFDAYGCDVSNAANIARLSAATVAMLTRQDVDMANFTASNAINNNFLVLAYYGVLTASAAWTAYDVYHTFEAEGLVPALEKLGIDLAAMAVGGVAGKLGGKFIAAKLAAHFEANPLLKIMLGNMVDRMLAAAAKLEGTVVGKAVAKVEGALLAGKDKVSKVVSGVKSKLDGGTPVASGGAGRQSWGKSIYEQGMSYEDAVARTLPSHARLPKNFKTFDFYDRATGTAISVKTLNTTTPAKVADPKQIYYSSLP